MDEDQFRFVVRGDRIKEKLRERCRNSTVVNTPTGPFCAEQVNASVAFNVQGRVSKGAGHCVGVDMVQEVCVSVHLSFCLAGHSSVCLSVCSLMSPLKPSCKWSSVIPAMSTTRRQACVCAVLTRSLSSTAATIQTDTSMYL